MLGLDEVEGVLRELSGIMRALAGLRRPRLLETEITMPQLRVLFTVWEQDGITSSRLAGQLGVGAPTVSALVDRLAGLGYVTREPDPNDRRIARLRVTVEGRSLIESIFLEGRGRFGDVLRTLAPEEIKLLRRALTLLRVAAEQAKG